MTLPLDIGTWSEDRIQEELAARLPKGWAFTIIQAPSKMWVVRIFSGETEHWKGDNAAPNLALLSALGWLTLQGARRKTASPWVPRTTEINPARLHEAAYRVSSPDPEPEDLDPKVAAVYSQRPKGGR